MSPLSSASMSNCCCTSVTSFAGSSPASVIPANSSYSLPKPQLPTFLPRRSAGAADRLVLEGHLQRAGPLEDLADVGDLRALLAGGERLRHPGDRVVGLALGEHGLRHDVDAALEDLDVEALVAEEALVDGGEVAGELGLGDPLQLQLHLGRPAAGGVAAAVVVGAAAGGGQQGQRGADRQRAGWVFSWRLLGGTGRDAVSGAAARRRGRSGRQAGAPRHRHPFQQVAAR